MSDLLYLTEQRITASVKGETGNGGNITIDPDFVVLNHSSIIAQAVEGHGGNITITAGAFIPSADSIVSASSELGISGTVVINGPLVDFNGALVVLSSELRGAVALTRGLRGTRQPPAIEPGRGGAGRPAAGSRGHAARRSTSPAATSANRRPRRGTEAVPAPARLCGPQCI